MDAALRSGSCHWPALDRGEAVEERAKRFCPFWFAWVFFGVALFPMLGFLDVGFMKYTLVADRYLHVALLAIVALAASGVGTACARSADEPALGGRRAGGPDRAGFLVLSPVAKALCISTASRSFRPPKKKNPDCWMIHQTLGTWELGHHRPREAIAYFLKGARSPSP